MKKLLNFILILSLLFSFGSCQMPGVDAGEELVVIQKPWFFGSGGIKKEPVTSGRPLLAISTDFVKYNIKPVKHTENFEDVITYDNNPVNFEAYIQIRINSGKTPYLHEDFGQKWYTNNIREHFRTKIRGYCSKYNMFTLSTDRTIVDSLETIIHTEMVDLIEDLGMPLEIMNVIIGKVTPPQAVLHETTKTAAERQAIKTQEARKDREDARKLADIAKAKADQAYKNSFSGMTINQYLYLRSLEIEAEKINMVKGKKNVSINMVQGGGATPVIPLK